MYEKKNQHPLGSCSDRRGQRNAKDYFFHALPPVRAVLQPPRKIIFSFKKKFPIILHRNT